MLRSGAQALARRLGRGGPAVEQSTSKAAQVIMEEITKRGGALDPVLPCAVLKTSFLDNKTHKEGLDDLTLLPLSPAYAETLICSLNAYVQPLGIHCWPTFLDLESFTVQELPAAAGGAQCLSTAAAQPEANAEVNKGRSWGKYALGGLAAATGGVGFALMEDEAEHGLHAPAYPWSHSGWFSAYDHASIRRGHQVYQQVCRTCMHLRAKSLCIGTEQ